MLYGKGIFFDIFIKKYLFLLIICIVLVLILYIRILDNLLV